MNKRWEVKKSDTAIVRKLAKDLNVSKIVAHLLVLRGIKTFDEAKLFFRPELSHLHNPFLMKNMQKASDRVIQAIENGEVIGLETDHDCDGQTAHAILYEALHKIFYQDF